MSSPVEDEEERKEKVPPSASTATPTVLAIFTSTGDLGDVGRHAVAVALHNKSIERIKVLRKANQPQPQRWKCACPDDTYHMTESSTSADHIEYIEVEWYDPQIRTVLRHHLRDVTHILTCLGNRVLFHRDDMSKHGMERILSAMELHQRLIMLSSVGVGEDWPPMEWSKDGRRLESCFRTISWAQHQDLCGGETAVKRFAEAYPDWEYQLVRVVLLPDAVKPSNEWIVQTVKNQEPYPAENISKLDCARFLIQQVLQPDHVRQAVTVGRVPDDQEIINW